MPLAAYFWMVGTALLTLLFFADSYLPRAPIADPAAADRPAIRIHSDRKLPERVVLDTQLPVSVAVAAEIRIAETASSPRSNELPPIAQADNPAVANAFAQMPRVESRPPETADRKRERKQTHVAARPRKHVKPPMFPAERRSQFAWFGPRYW
jgi:hypothetical protein